MMVLVFKIKINLIFIKINNSFFMDSQALDTNNYYFRLHRNFM